jgi:hypothetical protein
MIVINDILVSEDIIEKEFVCNLSACKGECCVAGEQGAPLDEDELAILADIWPKVKPYLSKKNQKAVEKQGHWIDHGGGEYATPLVNGGGECAYVIHEKGMALCGIERAWREGKIGWMKPISCHLYPIRLAYNSRTEIMRANYDRWDICKPACAHGKQLQVPIYKFLKEPLIRKFGEAFYAELEEVAKALPPKQPKNR